MPEPGQGSDILYSSSIYSTLTLSKQTSNLKTKTLYVGRIDLLIFIVNLIWLDGFQSPVVGGFMSQGTYSIEGLLPFIKQPLTLVLFTAIN